MPGGDARSELHLHCISGRNLHAQHSRRVHRAAVCSGTKALRGAPARPCSSGHRTEEKPTPFCAIGSPWPEQSAMVCRPLVHPSHASWETRSFLLRANCEFSSQSNVIQMDIPTPRDAILVSGVRPTGSACSNETFCLQCRHPTRTLGTSAQGNQLHLRGYTTARFCS